MPKMLINSVTELQQILTRLKPGESLVINGNGTIYSGNIPEKLQAKLTELPVKAPGKTPVNNLDANGLQEYIQTKSWVNSPGKAFKNAWDSDMLRVPKESVNSPLVIMWTLLVELADITQIKCNRTIVEFNHTFYGVSIGKVTAFYNKNLTLRFIETPEGKFEI